MHQHIECEFTNALWEEEKKIKFFIGTKSCFDLEVEGLMHGNRACEI